jgi:thymidylate synthase
MNKLDSTYKDLLKDILENGIQKGDRTGTGTISVFGRQIRHNMSEGFPLLTSKKMYFKGIVTELLWFLRGETNIQSLVKDGNNIWVGDAYKNYAAKTSLDYDGQYTKEEFINKIKTDDKFAQKWGDLGPIYGKQWRKWSTYPNKNGEYKSNPIDQIKNAIDTLETNPDSRRIIVSAWNVGDIDKMVLPPCHNFFQFYTRELSLEERTQIKVLPREYSLQPSHEELDEFRIPRRKISLMFNMRSVDTFLGLPFNIASYGLLLKIIAKEVNMVPEELIGNLGDVHLYSNHLESAKAQLVSEEFELPEVNIKNKNFEDLKFEDIELLNYKSSKTIKAKLNN